MRAQSETHPAAAQRWKRGSDSAACHRPGADVRWCHRAAVLGLVAYAAHRDTSLVLWGRCGAQHRGVWSDEACVGTKREEETEDAEKGEGVQCGRTKESRVERLSVESSWSDMNGKEWKYKAENFQFQQVKAEEPQTRYTSCTVHSPWLTAREEEEFVESSVTARVLGS